MRDLDSYDVFCALKLLESNALKKSSPKDKNEDEEVICACAKYLQQTTTN